MACNSHGVRTHAVFTAKIIIQTQIDTYIFQSLQKYPPPQKKKKSFGQYLGYVGKKSLPGIRSTWFAPYCRYPNCSYSNVLKHTFYTCSEYFPIWKVREKIAFFSWAIRFVFKVCKSLTWKAAHIHEKRREDVGCYWVSLDFLINILGQFRLNPAWHFWLSTRFSCCLKMKSVENILGYIREQFYRFSRGCKPRENHWNCSRKYPKMLKTD